MFRNRRAWGTLRPPIVAAAAYEGPGDIITSDWIGWWGLRAFSAAERGTVCCRIKKNIGGAETNINSDAVTGIVDVAAIVAHLSGDNGQFINIHDQFGSKDLDTGTSVIALNAIPALSLPAIFGATNTTTATLGANYSQPYTLLCVGMVTTGAAQSPLFLVGINQIGFAIGASADSAFMYAGAVKSDTALDDEPHALIGVFQGATSVLNVDGTEAAASNAGGGTLASSDTVSIATSANGYLFECGVVNRALTGGERTDLATNMKAYYGIAP